MKYSENKFFFMASYILKILENTYINHDVISLRLGSSLGLPKMKISSFLKIFDGHENFRAYTPFYSNEKEIQLYIKIYEKGKVSSWIKDQLENKNIKVDLFFEKKEHIKNQYKNVLMISGGTGIMPMAQILNKDLNETDSSTRFHLINLNKMPEDNFLKFQLDDFSIKGGHRFKLNNYFTRIKGEDRRNSFNKEELKKMFGDQNYDFVYVCGPPEMLETVCGKKNEKMEQGELKGILKELGFKSENVYKF